MDVYFYEAFEEEAVALKRYIGSHASFEMTSKTIQETGHKEPPARFISIRTQSLIPIEWSTKIDGVLSRSTGYDHLKLYQSQIQNVLPCGYLEEYATRAVAEHAILLMLSLLRKLPQQMKQFVNFERDGLTGFECAAKNLVVIGVGRIGSEIARISLGLGMNVLGVDLVQRFDFLKYSEKVNGIKWADVIICAMNLTEENRGYFSYNLLRQAQKGAIFINIARGEHSPTSDLLKLVQENHLGGIGLDVFDHEPSVADALRNRLSFNSESVKEIHELLSLPNVILTPHNAFNTLEAVERKSKFTADQIFHFLQHKKFIWQI